jgi:putative lipoprotein
MWQQVSTGCFLVLTILVTGAVMAQEPPPLVGVTWQWVHFADGEQEIDVLRPNYTIIFAEDGRYHARADCNIVLGQYSADDSTISILPGPTTLVACPPGSLADGFLRYLADAAVYSFTDTGDLLIELPIDSGTLTLSAQPQVTGLVTYRERMALPPDSVVRVQVQDVSIADAPTTIIGEQVIVTDGAQVPIPFAVSYPTSAIQENRRYSVVARIADGEGRLLFISDTNIPVITDDNPTSDIEIVLVRVGS